MLTRTQAFFFAAITLLASSAHATKARLSALNQDVDGSYYLMDSRNIFLNPAQVADQKDSVNFELGRQMRPGTYSMEPDNEGGFVMSLGGGKLAAQLGRVTDFNRFVRQENFTMADLPNRILGPNQTFGEGQNNVDVIYGGGSGDLKWGGGLGLTRSKTATGAPAQETSVQALDVRGGVHTGRWEAFGSVLGGAQSETDLAATTAKFDEKYGVRAGGGFHLNQLMRVYAHANYDKYETNLSNGTIDFNGSRLGLMGGIAYVQDIPSKNGRWFASAELSYIDNHATDNNGVLPDERFNAFMVPFTVGVEADANSWLKARASVRQNVLIGFMKNTIGQPPGNPGTNDDNYFENSPNNTSVAIGLGGTLNNFNLDVALVQNLGAVSNGDDNGHLEGSVTYMF